MSIPTAEAAKRYRCQLSDTAYGRYSKAGAERTRRRRAKFKAQGLTVRGTVPKRQK